MRFDLSCLISTLHGSQLLSNTDLPIITKCGFDWVFICRTTPPSSRIPMPDGVLKHGSERLQVRGSIFRNSPEHRTEIAQKFSIYPLFSIDCYDLNCALRDEIQSYRFYT